ncbi:DnaB-like helicase N-terminal domain-containing protein [Embleya sp. NPDC059259]|uniref:DnaB-like helicase N-terminal domain-containing protein n=1 Tax=unclassified Embleya TaxID=2699296 RepID=UPI0036BD6790
MDTGEIPGGVVHPHLHAEQALLGALLVEPDRIEDVRGLLLPEHMYRPAHEALYRVLLEHPEHRSHGRRVATAERVMALVATASAHAAGLTPVYAHTLMAACPHPRNAALYATMIIEASDHRALARPATRLGQVAAADQERDGLTDTLDHHRALHAVLDNLAHHWGEPHNTLTPPETRTLPATPPCRRDLADEQSLVAALIVDPAPLAGIQRWLIAKDFVDPGHAALYRTIGGLVHRGEPVDPLTVLWEAQRRGHLADGSLASELVLKIGGTGVPGSTDYWAGRVLRAALLRTAVTGAHAVRSHAENPTLAIRSLIAAARHALAPLDAISNRWHSATGPSVPKTVSGATCGPGSSTAAAARSRGPVSSTRYASTAPAVPHEPELATVDGATMRRPLSRSPSHPQRG